MRSHPKCLPYESSRSLAWISKPMGGRTFGHLEKWVRYLYLKPKTKVGKIDGFTLPSVRAIDLHLLEFSFAEQ